MKKIYKSFLTEEDKKYLDVFKNGGQRPVKGFIDNKLVKKIINKLSEDFKFEIKDESYLLLETRPQGHGWHMDTGTSNHMPWCQVGSTILIKDSATGGDTYYADDETGKNKIKVDREVGDLCAHTSDEWHMVDANSGQRQVLLMFL
tara:strand:+ start:830 stop:1267 length:438 start_codon:yes stop_codon:yes gene_type:complete